jgi:hypothetical protein
MQKELAMTERNVHATTAPRKSRPSAKLKASSEWRTFKDRDEWIAAMLATPERVLDWREKAIAIRIALHHNINTGQCDPSIIGLATGCGVSGNTIRSAIKALEKSGWVGVDRSPGRHRNAFQLLAPTLQADCMVEPFKHAEGLEDGQPFKERVPNPSTNDPNPSTCLHPNSESITAKNRTAKGTTKPKVKTPAPKTRRRRSQTPWPDGFHLDGDLADHAAKKAGWDHGRAFAEFERFENHHRAKGTVFADWKAAWRTWVSNGARFDRERAQKQQGGPVIDQFGNPALAPPPNRPPPPGRESAYERTLRKLQQQGGA